MKIVHVYPSYKKYGGAQKIILTLFNFFSQDYDCFLSSFQSYDSIHEIFKLDVKKENYLIFSFFRLKKIKHSIVISHHRKMTLLLLIVKQFFPFELIHVAHNVFYNKRKLSFFPKHIIAVSQSVKKNLIDYFKVKENNITVIYNGVKDCNKNPQLNNYPELSNKIKILYLGRIVENKQQLELVKRLGDSIDNKIQIDFAGEGPDEEKLKSYIARNKLMDNFNFIGFQTDVPNLILNYHFVMLYSKNEGLGLSLLESCMMGRPVIAKTIGGSEACGEICFDGYNGYVVNSIDEVKEKLNRLSSLSKTEYRQMSQNARKIYDEKFQDFVMKSNYSKFLKEVLSKKSHS